MKHRSALILFAALAAPLSAQNFWTVDALGRPGTQFLDLPLAVAVSSPGDFVLLRYVDPLVATYTATTVTHGLTIVGVGGRPGLTGDLTIQQLPAGQQVSVSEVRLAPFQGSTSTAPCRVRLLSNVGSVHLQCMTRDRVGLTGAANSQYEIAVQDCGFVTFTDCALPGVGPGIGNGWRVANTEHVVMQSCDLRPDTSCASAAMLSVTDSTVTLIDSTLAGIGADAPIRVCGATIRIAGATTVGAAAGGSVQSLPAATCAGHATVLIAPTASVGPVSGATATPTSLPALATSFDIASNIMTAKVHGDRQDAIVLFAGPRATAPMPLSIGALWIEPATAYLIAVLPPGAVWRGHHTASQPCPFTAWLQAATVGPAGIRLTNPSVLTFP